jgi:hypothetical protein
MFFSFLIPWTIQADHVSSPTGFFVLLGSLEFVDRLGLEQLSRHPGWALGALVFILPFWAIPILSLSNLFLWRRTNASILLAHRTLLGLAALTTVSRFWLEGMVKAGIGYWTNTAIILGSVLVEVLIWYDIHRKT